MSSSPEIKEGEDEDPHEVDEVPVQSHDLDDLVAAAAAREEAPSPCLEVTAPDFPCHDEKEDHPEGYVRAVKASDHEKGRAELGGAPRVFPGPDALGDELRPLEGLHADKRRT